MSNDVESSFQKAGSVDIKNLFLVSSTGKFLSVVDYMSEINIYEDIFSNCLYGNMLFVDSTNILKEFPIVGDEYLVVNIKTPTIDSCIAKTFRIYAVTDREIVKDVNTQIYMLHFISKEAVIDTIKPLFRSFTGKVTDVVQSIFDDYIKTNKEIIQVGDELEQTDVKSNLVVFSESKNSIKFISPGWTPFKCINWCASKAMPNEGKACNYLFFESNKNFYFGTVEKIFNLNYFSDRVNLGKYYYKVQNTDPTQTEEDKMYLAEDFQVIKTVDHLNNYDSGYLANRLVTLDMVNKKYDFYDYDHINSFKEYSHTQGENSTPLFLKDSPRDPASSIKFYPIHPGLHTLNDNFDSKMPEIYGNRKSNLMELTNFKIVINVPGRTDAEVGAMLYFSFPDVSPKSEEDIVKESEDKYYSGYYIISAIRHKINLHKHTMTLELIKDSLSSV